MIKNQNNNEVPLDSPLVRVYGFVDGFNLYHALERFEPAVRVADPDRYQKYKWLCLTSLINRFISAKSEDCGKSISVEYVKGSELEVTELLEEIKDLFVTGREYGHNEGLV